MYFNGTHASIYINDIFVTDALTFEFNESQQKLPIYGYKSVIWDSVLLGTNIVQGNFSVNFTGSHDLNDFLLKGDDDVALTPKIKGHAPFSRRFFDIKIIYADKEFVKRDEEGMPLAPSQYPTSYTGPTTDPQSYWGQKVQEGEYKYKDFFSVIELKDASLYRAQQAIVSDATPIGEFYDFVAKSVKISGT